MYPLCIGIDGLTLKAVRKAVVDTRAKWYHLGIELDIPIDSLKVCSVYMFSKKYSYSIL